MQKVLGAAAGLLIVLVSIAPADRSVSTESPPSSSTASWDWPK